MAVTARTQDERGNEKVARATRTDDLVTILMGTWLMIGLFVDGWAHNNLGDALETFFTPWHGVFYSGFAATAAWMLWLVARNQRQGLSGMAAIPQGYGLGVIGIGLFGLGGFGDMLWHIIFGIEVSIEALLSPTHLLIFVGGALIMSSPARALWAVTREDGEAFGLGQLFPALLSVTLTGAFTAFMNQYQWVYNRVWPFLQNANADIAYWQDRVALGNFLLSVLFLMVPLLVAVKRWRLPVGSVTFLFGVISVLMGAMNTAHPLLNFAAPAAAGVVGDVLLAALRPAARRIWAYRAFAAAVPVAVGLGYFMAGRIVFGQVAWSLELSAGITTMGAIFSLGISLLLAPGQKQA